MIDYFNKFFYRRKITDDTLSILSIIFKEFTSLSRTRLKGFLRSDVGIEFNSIDILLYRDYIAGCNNPALIGVIDMKPLNWTSLIVIDNSFSFAAIDRLFGGSGVTEKPLRELTEIERSVMEGFIVRFIGNLRDAWANIIDLRPRLGRVEVNPEYAMILQPGSEVIKVEYLISFAGEKHQVSFCIPIESIVPVLPQLSSEYYYCRYSKDRKLQSRKEQIKINSDLIGMKNKIELCSMNIDNLKNSLDLKLKDIECKMSEFTEKLETINNKSAHQMLETSTSDHTDECIDPIVLIIRGWIADGKINEAAVLLITYGEKRAGEIVSHLREDETELVMKMIFSIESVGVVAKEAVCNELESAKSNERYNRLGGPDYAVQILKNVFGKSRAQELITRIVGMMTIEPFEFIRRCDSKFLSYFITNELPQVIAVVVRMIGNTKGLELFKSLPSDIQSSVAKRLNVPISVPPDILRELERVLEKELSTLATEDVGIPVLV